MNILKVFLILIPIFIKNIEAVIDENVIEEDTLNVLEDIVNISEMNEEDKVSKIVKRTYGPNLLHREYYLNGSKLMRQFGFIVQEYDVQTEDGYMLSLIRIKGNGSPVFLMHGALLSSDDFVTNGNISMAYLLAAEGYDVWMGNARGNKYSKRHRSLSPFDQRFWYFSYHEIGVYDLPAMINRVLAETRKEKLIYIGFSQGTTAFFAMASEKPDYGRKVKLMIALSPVGAANFKSPFFRLVKALTSNKTQTAFEYLRNTGFHEMLSFNDFRAITTLVCTDSLLQTVLCKSVLDFFVGYNGVHAHTPKLPVVYSHLPAGCSTKQIQHYAQAMESGKFAKFDYGPIPNMKLYSSSEPPLYPINNIRTPIVFFHGEADLLAPPEDVLKLSQQLPRLLKVHKVASDTFGHVDFLYAKDLKVLLVDEMMKYIRIYDLRIRLH